MMLQYRLFLEPSGPCRPCWNWGYRLYSALLRQLPPQFGDLLHRDGVKPVSQYFTAARPLCWTVTLLGQETCQAVAPVLDSIEALTLEKDKVTLRVTERTCDLVEDAEALFVRSAGSQKHLLRFCTPTAFKSRGRYLTLPSGELVVHNLVNKWNGCFPDCPIEDEDGEGLDALAAGLVPVRFSLRDGSYWLKGQPIPGFVGEVQLENRLHGFHRELADALLTFAGLSGVGIKTALGMGGTEQSRL